MSKQTAVMPNKEKHDYLNEATIRHRGADSCRFCAAPLSVNLVDLGMSPLCESYLTADQANAMEPFYPLHVFVCESVLPRTAWGIRACGTHFHRICILLVVFGFMAETLKKIH